MTDAGPWSNQIWCNKTNVTRRQANQGTLGDEGALTFYKLESWWVSVCCNVQMYLGIWSKDVLPFWRRMQTLTSRTKPRVFEACRSRKGNSGMQALLFLFHMQKSGQVEMKEGQGQPEQGGERAQNVLRHKDRACLGRKIRRGWGNSGENMLSKLVGLENGKP